MPTDKPTLTQTELEGWEDAAFAEFVASEDVAVQPDEATVAQVDKLKKALAKLADDGQFDSCKLTTSNGLVPDVTSQDEDGSVADREIAPAELTTIDCPELTEAFLDDAGRGIAALDQAVINYESSRNREEALGKIGRELHTLKGAAAVVGLQHR